MFIGVMHGYALDLLQARLPFTCKYNVLSDVSQELLIRRNRKKASFYPILFPTRKIGSTT